MRVVVSLICQPSGQCLCSQSMAAPSKPSAVYAMPQSKTSGTKAQANSTCPIASFAARMGQAPPVRAGAMPWGKLVVPTTTSSRRAPMENEATMLMEHLQAIRSAQDFQEGRLEAMQVVLRALLLQVDPASPIAAGIHAALHGWRALAAQEASQTPPATLAGFDSMHRWLADALLPKQGQSSH